MTSTGFQFGQEKVDPLLDAHSWSHECDFAPTSEFLTGVDQRRKSGDRLTNIVRFVVPRGAAVKSAP